MRTPTIVLLAVLVAGCSLVSIDLTPRIKPLEERTVEGRGKTKILLTDVSGFLSEEGQTQTLVIGAPAPRVGLLVRFREELKKAAEDEDIKALVVRINSPGGTVTASDILYKELQLYKRTAKVPVIAVMMDVAASGGYYLALAADTIVAHPTTVTGSIGVIMVTVNAEGLLQKIGVTAGAIKSGELKDMGSPFRALTGEERRIFQSVIDGLQGQFLARVVESRKLPMDSARRLADGRVYTAQQALDAKLIDRIGYMDDVLELARKMIKVDEAKVVVYHRPADYRATYYARSEVPSSSVDVTVSRIASIMGAGPGFFYLWWP
ncbi:MAG TPA: signal peptide peptidase SppA [Methylomirabilota bacterium]|nr:signal peptide peptidase SppA [Methylomirabilota bacterium]